MRDNLTENWLTIRGYKWVYHEAIPLRSIDVSADAQEQIRLGATIDLEHVAKIELTIQDGGELPAVVLYEEQGGRFRVLDGLHRLTVFGTRALIDAYVVEVSSGEDVEIIRRTINLKHGMGLNTEERLQHAIYLKRSRGWTTAKAARTLQVKEGAIVNALATEEGLAFAAELTGYETRTITSAMGNGPLARVKAVPRKDLAKAIVEAARRHYESGQKRLPDLTLKMLCSEAHKVQNDREALDLMKTWEKTYPGKAKRNGPSEPLPDESAPVYKFQVFMKGVVTAAKKALAEKSLRAEPRRKVLAIVRQVAEELSALAEEYEIKTSPRGNRPHQDAHP